MDVILPAVIASLNPQVRRRMLDDAGGIRDEVFLWLNLNGNLADAGKFISEFFRQKLDLRMSPNTVIILNLIKTNVNLINLYGISFRFAAYWRRRHNRSVSKDSSPMLMWKL